MSDALLKLFEDSTESSTNKIEVLKKQLFVEPEIRKSTSQTRINFADLVIKAVDKQVERIRMIV